jgi:GxxExxY protein
MTQKFLDELTFKIIGCAIEVHKQLGPGLLESTYERCFLHELAIRDLGFKAQMIVPLVYKGVSLDIDFRLDVLIEDLIVVELKAIEAILPVHQSQVLTFLKLMQKPKGILFNFNCTNIFKEGQQTFVNEYYKILPKD